MSIASTSSLQVRVVETVTSGGKSKTDQLSASSIPKWVNATGALGITKQYNDSRTLATTSEDLDLAGGVTGIFGAVTFTKIKKFLVSNVGTGNIKVGAAGSNTWATMLNSTGIITLPPGALFYFECPDTNGVAVTAGTGDILKVEATGAGGAYEILVEGE